jgi:hypothetical protein
VSDELSRLQHRLEQATAPECPSDALLDTETASLRDGWLALGELLQAVQPALEGPLALREPPRRRSWRRLRLAGIAAVAASLLVGVTLAGKWMRAGRPNGPALLSATSPSETDPANVDPSGIASSQRQATASSDDLDWDWHDPLDQQIALAAEEVVRIQQDWDCLDDAFGPLYRGLEQMEQDLDESTL